MGLRHVGDVDAEGQKFAMLTLLEAFLGTTGLIFIDIINGRRFPPREYQDLNPNVFSRTLITFLLIALVQVVMFFTPLSIRDWEIALATVFVPPCEELFFRGFIMSIFIKIGHDDHQQLRLGKRQISYLEIAGIFISAIAFAALHINYYGDISLMLTVFLGGVVLALLYWYWRDLTPLVLAHFLLNILVVGQQFFMVNLV